MRSLRILAAFLSVSLFISQAEATFVRMEPGTGKGGIYVRGSRILSPENPIRYVRPERPSMPMQTDERLFTDVSEQHPNFDAIAYVAGLGMIPGISATQFAPNELITRAEFTKAIASRMFTPGFIENCFTNISHPYPPEYALLFKDTAKEGEEAKYVCAALMAGVVHGYDDGMFRMEDPINFAEAAKILTRTYDVSFLPYRGEGNEWFKLYAMGLSINGGIPDTIEKFDSLITRAEAAEMIYRIDAGVTNRPRKSYADLMVSTGWMMAVQNFIDWAL